MDIAFSIFLGAMLYIGLWTQLPIKSVLMACSSVTQCEVHGEFKTKDSCEEMKAKLEKNENILEFICEEEK